ncbi:MAG TPA: glycosyltransferase 87 family protein [Mycobacteriales bacterium]|nr:glycosyltransferase 87 family protein [Mycobacteriales bacterium]
MRLATARAQRCLLLAAAGAGVAEIVLARRSAAPGGILHHRFGLLGTLALMWVAFAIAAALLWRVRRTRTAVVVALILGVALRIAAISPKAPLSDDLYRYSWDGIVQAHGIDPYRYAPLDPALARLRTSHYLFPPASSTGTRINRPTVRTIYPPVAEAWFTVLHVLVPMRLHDRGLELAGLVVDLALLAVLLALLRGERRRWVVLYALCPLPVIEAVQNAHVDGLAALLLLLTVLALRRGRGGWAALALAAATLVKIYPLLFLPLLLRSVGWRERLRRLAIFAGAVVLAYAPHVVAVGPKVLGYLPGYLQEEHYAEGTRYLLVDLLGVTGNAATVVVAGGLLAVLVIVWRSRLSFEQAAMWLFAAVLLLATPVQPWYALTLVALIAVTGEWPLLVVCAAGYGVFFGTILDSQAVRWGHLGYGAAAGLLAVSYLVRRRWPQPPRNSAEANSRIPSSNATLAS